MKEIEFHKPETLARALGLLEESQGRAVIVNGGTDIVPKITRGAVNPGVIIYIHDLPGLKGIKEEDGFVVIGGAATYSDVAGSQACRRFPGLIQAVGEIGSPPIRHLGTPAGNIGSAVPAADFNVVLLALGASVVLASKCGRREMAVGDVFAGPYQTVLESNELIEEIRIPVPGPNTCSSFIKLARRKAMDIAQVSVAVSMSVDGAVCRDVRIALGAINPVPFRARSLEKALVGKEIEKGLKEIRGVFPSEAVPREDRFIDYKRQVTGAMIERAVYKAYGLSAGGDQNGQEN